MRIQLYILLLCVSVWWLVLGSAEVEEIIAMRKERVAMRDKGDVEHRD